MLEILHTDVMNDWAGVLRLCEIKTKLHDF